MLPLNAASRDEALLINSHKHTSKAISSRLSTTLLHGICHKMNHMLALSHVTLACLAHLFVLSIASDSDSIPKLFASTSSGSVYKPTRLDTDASGLPADFDASAYLDYNPDVAASLVKLSQNDRLKAAEDHFRKEGCKEPRMYKRVNVILGYVSYGGLTNQVYGHTSAMTLAAALGADLIIPPSVARNGFNKVHSMQARLNQQRFTYTPFAELFDEASIFSYLKGRGVAAKVLQPGQAAGMAAHLNSLHSMQPREFNPFHAKHAQQLFQLPNATRIRVAQLPTSLFAKGASLPDVVANISRAVLHEAEHFYTPVGGYGKEPPVVVVNLMWPMLGLALKDIPMAADVIRQLKFAPYLQQLAAEVEKGIAKVQQATPPAAPGSAAGGRAGEGAEGGAGAAGGAADAAQSVQPGGTSRRYNGLHLRLETDSTEWQGKAGGMQRVLAGYLQQCEKAGFNSSTPLYVASGLLSYGSATWPTARRQLLGSYASELYYKERFLTSQQLAGLTSEQRAAVDFLVLEKSEAVVGFSASTFSWLLREMRALLGIAPRGTMMLAHRGVMGDGSLFARAAVLAV